MHQSLGLGEEAFAFQRFKVDLGVEGLLHREQQDHYDSQRVSGQFLLRAHPQHSQIRRQSEGTEEGTNPRAGCAAGTEN